MPSSLSYIDTSYNTNSSVLYYLEPLVKISSKNKLFESNEILFNAEIPSAPYGFKLNIQGANVQLTWNYFDNAIITSFDIYKWQVGEEPQKIASIKPSEKSYLDKLTNSESQIFYYIKAVNEFGESEPSSKIELITNK